MMRFDKNFVISYFSFTMMFSWIELFKKYVWHDFEFIAFLAILIIMDTLSGMLVAYRQGKFNSKTMGNAVTKVFVISISLISIHSISSIKYVGKDSIWVLDFVSHLDSILYGFIALRELLSINENLSMLGYPLMPDWLMRVFKRKINKKPVNIHRKEP